MKPLTSFQKTVITNVTRAIAKRVARRVAGQIGVDSFEEELPETKETKSRARKFTIAAALGGSVFLIGRTIVTLRARVEALEEKVGLFNEIVPSNVDRITRIHNRVDELETHIGHLRENVRGLARGDALLASETGTNRDATEDPMP